MASKDIESALNVILANSPAFPVAFENNETDQTGAHYAQSFDPVEPSNISVAFNGSQELTGIYQVLIKIPLNTGKSESNQGAADLESKFSRGTQLLYNGQLAEVEKVYIGSGFAFDNWWVVPCSVEYKGFS